MQKYVEKVEYYLDIYIYRQIDGQIDRERKRKRERERDRQTESRERDREH